jgi:transposase-like protein
MDFTQHTTDFFLHLQSKLNVDIGGTQLSKIVIGSDEEAALTKAIKQCFPSSANILCSRHLEENVHRYLTNNIGVSNKVRKQVVSDIFGKHGLKRGYSFWGLHRNLICCSQAF